MFGGRPTFGECFAVFANQLSGEKKRIKIWQSKWRTRIGVWQVLRNESEIQNVNTYTLRH